MRDVSIVIPVYNRSHLLRETLVSCLIQTYRQCEIIVVDDSSEEDIATVAELACLDLDLPGAIRYVRQPRLGANAARNRGLSEASGEFIQFLDSDDLLHPDKIEIQREALLRAPDLDMVFCQDQYFHHRPGDGQLLWNVANVADVPSYLDRFLWDDPVWHTGSPLWRRRVLERIGPWNEGLCCWQDWEFHIRALCRGIQYAHVPAVLQYIRDHDQTRSTNLAPLMVREQSKLEAALAVSSDLRRASLWTPHRGDALATFLLSIAVNLSSIGTLKSIERALERAAEYAESRRLRLTAMLMLATLPLLKMGRMGRRTPMGIVYRVAQKLWPMPTHESRWKNVTSVVGSDVPSVLVQALDVASNAEGVP
jgi:GT2 family glycosyltransferase